MPPMTEDEALASAALQGLATQGLEARAFGTRPFRSPHHSASAVALVGGGSPPRPREISLAHAGVLFLDEFPGFSRGARQAAFPARFQLVATMNPCPCGYLGAFVSAGKTCRCTPEGIERYRTRLSGPLLDRIDLQVEVHAVKPQELMAQPDGEASSAAAGRVGAARQHQLQGQAMQLRRSLSGSTS